MRLTYTLFSIRILFEPSPGIALDFRVLILQFVTAKFVIRFYIKSRFSFRYNSIIKILFIVFTPLEKLFE
jgi:hypothetical protein